MIQKSICKSCNEEISFNGKNWEHVHSSPRHIAKPLRIAMGNISQEMQLEMFNLFIDITKQDFEKACERCKNISGMCLVISNEMIKRAKETRDKETPGEKI